MRLVCWVPRWMGLLWELGEGREARARLASEGRLGPHRASFAFVIAEVSTRGYTTAFLLCPHPLQPKWNSLMGYLARPGVSQACSFQKKLQTGQRWPTGSQENCNTKAFTPDQIPPPGAFELLVYTEENLFPTLSREAAGHRHLCHRGMA